MIRVVAVLLFLLAVVAYAAPCVIAIWRAHRRWPLVLAVDVLLGWTIVGWLMALAMALDLRLPTPKKRPRSRPTRAPVANPPATGGAVPANAAPVREHVEPPPLQDEAYARWLDGGAAMNV